MAFFIFYFGMWLSRSTSLNQLSLSDIKCGTFMAIFMSSISMEGKSALVQCHILEREIEVFSWNISSWNILAGISTLGPIEAHTKLVLKTNMYTHVSWVRVQNSRHFIGADGVPSLS